MTNRQTLIVENVMSDLKKSDCISMDAALASLGVARNTLNSYLNVLGVAKHKFPLDKRSYITKHDFERVKTMIDENRDQ